MTAQNSIGKMNFEDALGELEGIVRNLETGQTSLEHSIEAYERGMKLKNHCESKLREAKAKIEKITVSPEGGVSAAPLDAKD